MNYGWIERLGFSKARRQDSDIDTLRAMFPTCASVTKTSEAEDRAGTDYVVQLRRGAQLRVDAKARDRGCRQFWKAGPEVALEVWSVKPSGNVSPGKTGWTLDESKEIDLILFTFDPQDHPFAYVRPLPLLRETFRRNYSEWRTSYKSATQRTDSWSLSWESECVYVPLVIVDQAIEAMSRRKVSQCLGSV